MFYHDNVLYKLFVSRYNHQGSLCYVNLCAIFFVKLQIPSITSTHTYSLCLSTACTLIFTNFYFSRYVYFSCGILSFKMQMAGYKLFICHIMCGCHRNTLHPPPFYMFSSCIFVVFVFRSKVMSSNYTMLLYM